MNCSVFLAALGACVLSIEVNAFLLYAMSVPNANYMENPKELLADHIAA